MALALSAATLTGCATSSPTEQASADGAQQGGTVQIALPDDPTCIDPQQTGQRNALEIVRGVVDSLTDQDPETGEIRPWLAESFTVSEDAREFRFTLRPDVTFSDGTPVEAEAVQSTFDWLAEQPASGAAAYIQGYTGTEIEDPLNLTVGFEQPNAQFLQATAGTSFGILSPASAGADLAARCRGEFIGSGPFVVQSYTPDQDAVITRRDDYAWPSSLATNPGAAHLDEVRFLFVPEDGARAAALESGQIDVSETVQLADQPRFDGNGFSLLTTINPGAAPPLSPNHDGVLGDTDVRRAILLGIDREELVRTVFGPEGRVATGVLSSTTPFYVDQSAEVRYDPTEAAALLDGAGWVPGPDGIRVRDGVPLRLVWLIPFAAQPENEQVQQQLRRLGIDVVLDVVTAPVYVERQDRGDFDFTAVDVSRADPDVLRNLFLSTGPNLWGLPGGELDTFLERQAGLADSAQRQEAVDGAVRLLIEGAHTIPLYETRLVHGVTDDVRDLRLDASLRLTLHDAWRTG
ncbi:ABC transporter substrate-binding protein [Pseudonocardia nematodicida]|uniref:ABC transporter substrate-binding protein n=1 Tax=Pseudonocardia nematodicida TaxID=1206997 RepID=A0ABV1KEC3_9PSEU